MVGKPMAYNSIHSTLDDGRLISEILQKIQSSSKETRLWEEDGQQTQPQPSVMRAKIAAKRAQFMLNNAETENSATMDNNTKVKEDSKKNELIILWNEPDVNNNDVMDNDSEQVCIEPNDVVKGARQSRLVRRSSSVDSGIIVRTPSEKNEDRKRLVSIMTAKCCRRTNPNDNNKARVTRRKSSSLPNLNEIDLNKFELINFQDRRISSLNTREEAEDEFVEEGFKKQTETHKLQKTKSKNLFDIDNYTRGHYKKTRLSEMICRNNTFSVSGGQKSPGKPYSNGNPFDSKNNQKDRTSINENEEFVLNFDIDSTDHHGDTCLHYASSKGDINTIKYLLERGGNVWRKNHNKQLPIDMSRDFKTAQLLSQATIFYTEPEKHRQGCNNISSTIKLAFDL